MITGQLDFRSIPSIAKAQVHPCPELDVLQLCLQKQIPVYAKTKLRTIFKVPKGTRVIKQDSTSNLYYALKHTNEKFLITEIKNDINFANVKTDSLELLFTYKQICIVYLESNSNDYDLRFKVGEEFTLEHLYIRQSDISTLFTPKPQENETPIQLSARLNQEAAINYYKPKKLLEKIIPLMLAKENEHRKLIEQTPITHEVMKKILKKKIIVKFYNEYIKSAETQAIFSDLEDSA